MKALGLVVSDEKIFENCILKTYFLTPWPTYATNQNHLNNFGRGPPRDHSCEVWSKSNEWFQRRRCLSKKVFGRRTTDDGQSPVTIAHHEHFVLRWAKKTNGFSPSVILYTNVTVFKIYKHLYLSCAIFSSSFVNRLGLPTWGIIRVHLLFKHSLTSVQIFTTFIFVL